MRISDWSSDVCSSDLRVGVTENVDFVLADADGFDEDDVESHCVENCEGVPCGRRQAAPFSARRHRADQHAGIFGMPQHPNAISQDRAARKWTPMLEPEDRGTLCIRAEGREQ